MGDSVVSYKPVSADCPFLSIPGELRNCIYDFCAEEGVINLPVSTTRFGNLRYVCKLLRTEFTPVYLAMTDFALQAADIHRYLTAFYPDLQSRDRTIPNTSTDTVQTSNLGGRVRIDVSLGTTLDLSLFSRLRCSSSGMHIILVRGASINWSLQDASKLLRAIMEPACPIDYQEIVQYILFRYSLNPEIVIKLHRGVSFEELIDLMPDRSPRQWLVQQGLPALRYLNILMESSEGILREPVAGSKAHIKRPRQYLHLYPVHKPDGSDPRPLTDIWPNNSSIDVEALLREVGLQ